MPTESKKQLDEFKLAAGISDPRFKFTAGERNLIFAMGLKVLRSVLERVGESDPAETQNPSGDAWFGPVNEFVEGFTGPELLTTALILSSAVSIPTSQHDNILKGRVRKVMLGLGWTDSRRKQVWGDDGFKHSVKYWSIKDTRI